MARAYPAEFRDDVVAVARKHEAPVSQIAKDFGISEATLHNWLKRADIEDGVRPGVKWSPSASAPSESASRPSANAPKR
jgi:transposase-like protein